MATNLKLADAAVNAQADALARLLDNGYLRIYDGAQPATADDAVTTQVLLAELRFSATSAPAAIGGVLTFAAITKESSAKASSTAAWYRALQSDGATPVLDGSVGTSGCDLNFDAVAITAGGEVAVASFQHTVVKG
jgi:hypothetical protein